MQKRTYRREGSIYILMWLHLHFV